MQSCFLTFYSFSLSLYAVVGVFGVYILFGHLHIQNWSVRFCLTLCLILKAIRSVFQRHVSTTQQSVGRKHDLKHLLKFQYFFFCSVISTNMGVKAKQQNLLNKYIYLSFANRWSFLFCSCLTAGILSRCLV